jgi:hypothetical protein
VLFCFVMRVLSLFLFVPICLLCAFDYLLLCQCIVYENIQRNQLRMQVRFSEDLGEVYKVLIGFADDNDEEQNWLLDTVRPDRLIRLFIIFEFQFILSKKSNFEGRIVPA